MGSFFFSKSHLSILASLFLVSCAHFHPGTKNAAVMDIIQTANARFYLDERIWYQDVQAEIQGNTLVLSGEAFFQRPVKGLERRLKRAGYEFEIVDNVTYLPEAFPGDKGYAIVTDPFVMGRYKPVEIKQEGTEMLYGEPVRLIRDADPYFQVQSNTGYLGYIPKTAVRVVGLAEWNRYHVGQQAVFQQNLALDDGFIIKLGSRLPFLGDDTLLLADGSTRSVVSENYRIVDPASNPKRLEILESAKQYLGLPYVWGGRSAEGVDCSGFVMQSYALNDIYLPRDTDEMANVGRIIGLPGWTDALLPGDLLFFTGSRRLVTHVAIYMGEDKVIHSLGKGVQIHSLDPSQPDFSERLTETFIFAKRLFE